MTEPIRPDQAAARKAAKLPEGVIEAFNDLIALHYDGTSATFNQDDVVEEIMDSLGMTREGVFQAHLLDVEPVYRAAGWGVTYDKPGYNESYTATFTFTRRVTS